ncbi:MAG: tetratricopeptide repeat protein [Rhizomicrobium sp.]
MRVLAVLLFCLIPVAASAAPLDALFGQLKKAASPEEAKPIEDKIGGVFLQSGSASVELLMTRAQAVLAAGDKDTARQLFDAITGVAPNYAEGWHARASLQHDNGDDSGAIVSLEHTILLNPRQFTAMYELGNILEDYGNKEGALKLYRKALELDPQLEGAQKHVDALGRDVEGQGI